jgi:hypothetical protein
MANTHCLFSTFPFSLIVQRTYFDARKKEWLLRRWRRRIKIRRQEENEEEQEVDVSWTSWSVYMGCGGKSSIGTLFSSNTSVFLRKNCHSTSGLYPFSTTTDAILCNRSNFHCR